MSDVGLVCTSSMRKFGASVELFRNDVRVAMFIAPPVGVSQYNQFPRMKSTWEEVFPDLMRSEPWEFRL